MVEWTTLWNVTAAAPSALQLLVPGAASVAEILAIIPHLATKADVKLDIAGVMTSVADVRTDLVPSPAVSGKTACTMSICAVDFVSRGIVARVDLNRVP